jgi:hypothetical protein
LPVEEVTRSSATLALQAATSNSKAQPPKTLDTKFEIGRVLVRHDMPAVFDRIVGIGL